MKRIMMPIVLMVFCAVLAVAKEKSKQGLPERADSTAEVKTAITAVKGFGFVNSAHFERWDRQVFAAWWCPYSGRNTSHVVAYYLDPDKKKWIRFVETQVNGSHDLSAEMPCGHGTLVFKNTKGEEVLKYSVTKFFQKKEKTDAEQPPERDK